MSELRSVLCLTTVILLLSISCSEKSGRIYDSGSVVGDAPQQNSEEEATGAGIGDQADVSVQGFGPPYDTVYIDDDLNIFWGIKSDSGIFLDKDYYYMNYNPRWKIPYWVGYYLCADYMTDLSWDRSYFPMDPDVPDDQEARHSYYTNSGYDRGHNAAAADFKRSLEAYESTYVITNVSPQVPHFNRVHWRDLEQEVRDCVEDADLELWIFTGNLFLDPDLSPTDPPNTPPDTIELGQIGVPSHLFKAIVCRHSDGTFKSAGFIMPNSEDLSDYSVDYQVTIDFLESVTGYDFFPTLEEAIGGGFEAELDSWPLCGTWVP